MLFIYFFIYLTNASEDPLLTKHCAMWRYSGGPRGAYCKQIINKNSLLLERGNKKDEWNFMGEKCRGDLIDWWSERTPQGRDNTLRSEGCVRASQR